MELGLYPGWMDKHGGVVQEGLPLDSSDAETGEEFEQAMHQFDPSLQKLLNPVDEYKGNKSEEVSTQFMDSIEGDSVEKAPVLALTSPLLNEIKPTVTVSGQLESESKNNISKTLDDIDRLRAKFFMQEEPTFRGTIAEPKIYSPDRLKLQSYYDMMEDPLSNSMPVRSLETEELSQKLSPQPLPKGFEPAQGILAGLTPIALAEPTSQVIEEESSTQTEAPSPVVVKQNNGFNLETFEVNESLESEVPVISNDDKNELIKVTSNESSGEKSGFEQSQKESQPKEVTSEKEALDPRLFGTIALKDSRSQGAAIDQNQFHSLGIQNQKKIDTTTQLLIEKGGGAARIKLSPEGLGELDLRVQVKQGKITVDVMAENAETKKLLEGSLKDLRTQLESQNLKVENLSIQISEPKASQGFEGGRDSNQNSPNLALLRDMMGQARQESFGRQSNTMEDWQDIRSYGRGTVAPDPIRSALETQSKISNRYLGDSRGKRLSLVG